MRFLILTLISLLLTHFSTGDEAKSRDFQELGTVLNKICRAKLEQAPKEVIEETRRQEVFGYPHKMSEKSQLWLHQNISQMQNEEDLNIASKFEILSTPGTMHHVLNVCFWSLANEKPILVENILNEVTSFWNEREEPRVLTSPIGGGRLDWYWKLKSSERMNGIIHVGIERESRVFWCYELNKGIYLPLGDTLERIRAEIVQSDIALDRVGRGYLESKVHDPNSSPQGN